MATSVLVVPIEDFFNNFVSFLVIIRHLLIVPLFQIVYTQNLIIIPVQLPETPFHIDHELPVPTFLDHELNNLVLNFPLVIKFVNFSDCFVYSLDVSVCFRVLNDPRVFKSLAD